MTHSSQHPLVPGEGSVNTCWTSMSISCRGSNMELQALPLDQMLGAFSWETRTNICLPQIWTADQRSSSTQVYLGEPSSPRVYWGCYGYLQGGCISKAHPA